MMFLRVWVSEFEVLWGSGSYDKYTGVLAGVGFTAQIPSSFPGGIY